MHIKEGANKRTKAAHSEKTHIYELAEMARDILVEINRTTLSIVELPFHSFHSPRLPWHTGDGRRRIFLFFFYQDMWGRNWNWNSCLLWKTWTCQDISLFLLHQSTFYISHEKRLNFPEFIKKNFTRLLAVFHVSKIYFFVIA